MNQKRVKQLRRHLVQFKGLNSFVERGAFRSFKKMFMSLPNRKSLSRNI